MQTNIFELLLFKYCDIILLISYSLVCIFTYFLDYDDNDLYGFDR